MIEEARDVLDLLDSVYPDFIEQLREAYPWYTRWKSEFTMWTRGGAMSTMRKELAHYGVECTRLESMGVDEADLDVRILNDFKIWGPEGIIQEVIHCLKSSKGSGPYR